MDLAGILGIALGSGTIGAGIMKIIDRLLEHKLARKDKIADCTEETQKRLCETVDDHDARIKALECDKDHRDKFEQSALKALNALLLHAMTGNATGHMKKAQEQLVESIVENK